MTDIIESPGSLRPRIVGAIILLTFAVFVGAIVVGIKNNIKVQPAGPVVLHLSSLNPAETACQKSEIHHITATSQLSNVAGVHDLEVVVYCTDNSIHSFFSQSFTKIKEK